MKKLALLIASLALASLLIAAAASATVTTRLVRIQTDPTSADATATAYFERTTIVGEQTFVAPWVPVSWPINSQKTVTSAGKTLTYAEVSAFIVAIADQEYAAMPAK